MPTTAIRLRQPQRNYPIQKIKSQRFGKEGLWAELQNRPMTTTFGSRLKGLREARGWSQEKLGFELEVTGATISKWEHNRSEPTLLQLTQLRKIFEGDNITLDWLLNGDALVPLASNTRKLSGDEQLLLMHFKRLSSKKQKMLLGLLDQSTH